nr:hypothetical protein [Methylobacterium sp. NI91]
MKQTASISLDSFDPEVLAAAREVARRAGVPLESWIASVAVPETAKPGPRRRRVDAAAPAKDGAKDTVKDAGTDQTRRVGGRAADKAAAPRKETPQHKGREAAPVAAASEDFAAPSPAAALEASIGAMMRRLDALDRSISQEREASKADAARMIGDIERKVGELAGQLSAPRPLGRRGRPLATEVRDAVAEVRRRQRELEEGIAEWNSASAGEPQHSESAAPEVSEDVPVAASNAEAAHDQVAAHGHEPSPAIIELQRETSRLRDTLGGLATGRDVGELEQTMQAVASDLQRARDPRELAAIAAPIELMRVQVERLAGDVAENVHARVAGEVERLVAKVDGVLSGALTGPADESALDSVFRELDEIRRLVAALAGPERIQSLAQGVQAISAQIAQLQRDKDAGMAAIKPLLEEIRGELKTPDPSRELPRELLTRFEALAERLGRTEAGPVGELIERLETVAEKVDRVSAGGSGLDALERHVLALASRLDAPRDPDPAVARLERSMGDLLAQVAALRNGTDVEAAVERAVREAVAGASSPLKTAGGDVELLRADLAELRANQKGSDQRLQSTMEGVHSVLTRLSEQLDRTMTSAAALTAAAPQERAPSGSPRASASLRSAPPPRKRQPSRRPARAARRRPRRSAGPRRFASPTSCWNPAPADPAPAARPRRRRSRPPAAPTSKRASSPPPAAPRRPRRRKPRRRPRWRRGCATRSRRPPVCRARIPRPCRGSAEPSTAAAARCCSASPPSFWRSAPTKLSWRARARRPETPSPRMPAPWRRRLRPHPPMLQPAAAQRPSRPRRPPLRLRPRPLRRPPRRRSPPQPRRARLIRRPPSPSASRRRRRASARCLRSPAWPHSDRTSPGCRRPWPSSSRTRSTATVPPCGRSPPVRPKAAG